MLITVAEAEVGRTRPLHLVALLLLLLSLLLYHVALPPRELAGLNFLLLLLLFVILFLLLLLLQFEFGLELPWEVGPGWTSVITNGSNLAAHLDKAPGTP